MSAIDRDRGVTIRTHPAGFRVFIYKDLPGVYLDENGNETKPAIANVAGFDTELLSKQRSMKEKMAKARAEIEEEYALKEADLKNLADADSDGLVAKSEGRGKWAIYDGEQRVTKNDMTKAEAEKLLKEMTDSEDEDG